MHSLVIKLSSLGDVIQSFGAVADVAACSTRVTVLTTPPFHDLFCRCPHVDDVVLEERKSIWHPFVHIALRRRLRALGIDRVIDLQNAQRTAFYYRVVLPGLPWSSRWAQADNPCGDPARARDSILGKLAEQLEAADIPARQTLTPDLSWLAADISFLNLPKSYVVLLPGSSAAAAKRKRWPHYNALINQLEDLAICPVLIPGPQEMDQRALLRGKILLSHEGGPLSLSQMASVLRNAAFVVGNDSGPTHLAAHVGCRGLALFAGALAPAQTSLETQQLKIIWAPMIGDIAIEPVLSAVQKAVKRGHRS